MSGFNAEHPFFVHTLVAAAVLVAGDPVTGAGIKASDATDFIGFAMSDAAIGEHVPICSLGIVNVQLDSGATGLSPGDSVTYDTNGYDAAGAANGFAFSLDTAVALGYARIILGHASVA